MDKMDIKLHKISIHPSIHPVIEQAIRQLKYKNANKSNNNNYLVI